MENTKMTKDLKVGDKCIYDSAKDVWGNEHNHGKVCEIVEVRNDKSPYKYLIRWEVSKIRELVKKESLTKIKKPKTKETMEAQQPTTTTISVSDLKKIHDVACDSWKRKIEAMVKPFEDTVTLTEEQIGKMFDAANDSQAKVLEQVFGERFSNKLFDFGEEHTINTHEFEGTMHIRCAYATHGNTDKEIGFNEMYTPVIVIDGKEIELKTGGGGAYLKFKTK